MPEACLARPAFFGRKTLGTVPESTVLAVFFEKSIWIGDGRHRERIRVCGDFFEPWG